MGGGYGILQNSYIEEYPNYIHFTDESSLWQEAPKDLDGYSNTAALVQLWGEHCPFDDTSVYSCYTASHSTFPNGLTSCYVPSGGEVKIFFNNYIDLTYHFLDYLSSTSYYYDNKSCISNKYPVGYITNLFGWSMCSTMAISDSSSYIKMRGAQYFSTVYECEYLLEEIYLVQSGYRKNRHFEYKAWWANNYVYYTPLFGIFDNS